MAISWQPLAIIALAACGGGQDAPTAPPPEPTSAARSAGEPDDDDGPKHRIHGCVPYAEIARTRYNQHCTEWKAPEVIEGGDRAERLAEAVEIHRRGQDFADNGQWLEALELFERVYQLEPRPGVIFNIALMHQRLDDLDCAAAAYQAFIDAGPPPEHIENARRRLEDVKHRQKPLEAPPPQSADPC